MAETESTSTPKLPVLRLWWVAVAGVLGIGITLGVMWLLFAQVDIGGDPRSAATRLDIIRTALSVGIGAGGGIALWLTARRQRSAELQLSEHSRIANDTRLHQEKVAHYTEIDLRERRVTDLYAKAVEQLGNAKAPVRLGGLYSLERLAQANVEHRQTVVDVICSYLKIPFDPPATYRPGWYYESPSNDEEYEKRAELQTRLVAQTILERNLRVRADSTDGNQTRDLWANIDLDLRDATLVYPDFDRCKIRHSAFQGARFIGVARFRMCEFQDEAWFSHCRFEGNAFYNSVTFNGRAVFTGADFGLHASFNDSEFRGLVAFPRAIFRSRTSFERAKFVDGTEFLDCRFEEIVLPGAVASSFGAAEFVFDDALAFESPAASASVQSLPTGWRFDDTEDGRKIVKMESRELATE